MSFTEAISPLSPSPTTTSRAVDNPGATLDRDSFLKLLVAQLKYQDPTSPADTSQMLAQSAQLTMVDRLNEIADAVTLAGSTDQMILAGTMIGRDITFRVDDGSVRTERVDAVRFFGGDLSLQAGGYTVPLGAIEQLHAAAPATPPDEPPATPPVPPDEPPATPPDEPPATPPDEPPV